MYKLFTIILLAVILVSCSSEDKTNTSSYKITFKPELVIGNNTTIDDGWFVLLNDFCVLPNGDIYGVDYKGKK